MINMEQLEKLEIIGKKLEMNISHLVRAAEMKPTVEQLQKLLPEPIKVYPTSGREPWGFLND